jgi:hypothetical protein
LISAEPLTVARGAVRDGVACIENLAQLLGSRRVGPRQLPHALPPVQAGCISLVDALDALKAAMAEQLCDNPEGFDAFQAMLAHASLRVRELGATLKGREKAPLAARARLLLEASVVTVAGELDTVLRLTDLMGAAASSKTTAIDLGDVLSQRRPSMRSVLTKVAAVIELRTTSALIADARVVLELLDFAVATVVRAGVETPRIVVDRGALRGGDGEAFADAGADASLVITVDEPAAELAIPVGQGETRAPRVIDLARRAELPREAEVVRAAARRAGISLEIAVGGRQVKMVI